MALVERGEKIKKYIEAQYPVYIILKTNEGR